MMVLNHANHMLNAWPLITPHAHVLRKPKYGSEMFCTAVSMITVVNTGGSTCV